MTVPKVAFSVFSFLLAITFSLSPAHAQQAPAVVVAPARIVDLRESVDLTGRVVATQKVDIRARVAGFLEAVDFKEGQTVTAGTMLYQVEDGAYRAAVQEIEGSIQAAEAQRDLAVLERDRAKQLITSNTISQAKVDTANAEVKKAEAELVRLKGSKQSADLNLSYTRITAPFDGVLGLTTADVGALVGPDTGPLVTLTRLDPIYVVVSGVHLAAPDLPRAGAEGRDARRRQCRADLAERYRVSAERHHRLHRQQRRARDRHRDRARASSTTRTPCCSTAPSCALSLSSPTSRTFWRYRSRRSSATSRAPSSWWSMLASKVELRRIDVSRSARGLSVVSKGLKEGENVITEGVGKVRPGIVVDAAAATGG